MIRGETGKYAQTTVGNEVVNAFLPAPLPPNPDLELSGAVLQILEAANLALGRLDGVSTLLPDTDLFLYSYIRKEAIYSSQIEGTQSSLSDLLLFEMDEAPGVPISDAQEVSQYVSAMTHGLARMEEGFPLSNRLLREIHKILLSHGRGSSKEPGNFRRSQNWIGGTRPGNAKFVPPPPMEVQRLMSELESFIHEENEFPVLIKAGLAHVQLETIHPFLDGNGRVGRLLITFLLCHAGVLKKPLLYLSLYLKKHREEYYDHLDRVRRTGDWEGWLAFYLEGVQVTADNAASTAQRITELFQLDQERLQPLGRKAGSLLRVHDALTKRPVVSIKEVTEQTGLTFPPASSAMQLLIEMDIVRELTGKGRNRLFVYDKYLELLSDEG